MKIPDHLPNKKDLYPVYGLIVMLIYGWSLIQFLWLLPSWLKFLTPGEIGVILSYTLVTDLLESFLILSGLMIVALILPAGWFRNDFVLRGGLSAVCLLVFFMLAAHNSIPYDLLINKYALWGVIGFACLHVAFGKIRPLRELLGTLADRSIIFLYISFPSSVLALMLVLVRNI